MHKISIRKLLIEDALISFHWRNDPEIWQYTGSKPHEAITEDIERNWIEIKLTEKNSSRFAIIADNNYIGNIQITDIIKHKRGQYHIFIGEKSYWGKGIGSLATAQIIRYSKDRLKLKELYLKVNPLNASAIKLYENCGFVKVNDDIKMRLKLSNLRPAIVSVFVMTYNHERFITQALEGILMQKTNFDFDIVVGEDCSTDKTREIILEFEENYPGKFKLLLHNHNIGPMANHLAVQNACTGKYIAMCEGDDYWIDSYKLQKQVDFLDANPEFSCCFHNTYLRKNEEITAWRIYDKEDFSILDTFSTIALFHTSSILFRRTAFYLPKWFPKIVSADMAIMSIVASKGKLKRIPEFMSVYRKNSGGLTETSKVINNYHKNRIELMTYLNKEFKYKYRNEIAKVISYHKSQLKRKQSFFKRIKQIIFQRTKIINLING